MEKPYICPICGEKQPLKWLLLGGRSNFVLKCKNCHNSLWPSKDPLPAHISTPLGFICGVLPFMLYWHFVNKNFLESFIFALIVGLIGFICVCIYTYRNTRFIVKNF